MRRAVIVVLVAACGFRGTSTSGDPDAAPDASIDAPGCPADYVQLAALPSRYRVSGGGGVNNTDPQGRGTWVTAEADCRDDGFGTHLAIAETLAEHTAFVDVVSGASRWLGVTDRKVEGTWKTILGGSTFYSLWGAVTLDTNSNCLLLTRVPSHEATPCDDPRTQFYKGYICECDGAAVDLNAF